MVHWLADKGKLKLDENVANIWPEFGTNGKDQIKSTSAYKQFQTEEGSPALSGKLGESIILLNHTSGLHNAFAGVSEEDPTLFCDFDECLKRIAMVAPETEPGREQLYHYLSYGWLCGGIIEIVSADNAVLLKRMHKMWFLLHLTISADVPADSSLKRKS
ncbi:beta-lactamase domain-containing protein 2-like protein [Tanacetum coccineum]